MPFLSFTQRGFSTPTLNFLLFLRYPAIRFPATINPPITFLHVFFLFLVTTCDSYGIRLPRNWNEKLERCFRSTSFLLHQRWDGGATIGGGAVFSSLALFLLSLFLFYGCAPRPCLVPSLVSSSNKKMI